MSADRPEGTTTYRGRSLEEVLPKIREELGRDAVIERQRTGLVGGVAGFFQREMIEVDARPARPGEAGVFSALAEDDEAALRAATAPLPPDPDRDEGFAAPAMRRIAAQSEPFATFLQDAEHDVAEQAPDDDWNAWASDLAEVPPPAASQPPAAPQPPFVPQSPSARAAAAYGQAGSPTPPEAYEPPAAPPAPAVPQPPAAPLPALREPRFTQDPNFTRQPQLDEAAEDLVRARPAAAAALEAKLVAHGLSGELASSCVAEAIAHGLPVAPRGSGLKRQIRAALARRIPVQSGFGGAGRTIALIGPGGSGKTRAAAGLAAAYAHRSDLPVVCLSLRPRDVGAELAELLDPHGVAVRPVDGGADARTIVGTRAGQALVVIDTPAVSARSADDVAWLARELQAAGVTETHLVLPATVAGAVAREALSAFAPLAPSALLVTHADDTDHIGALVDLAVTDGTPLSYVVAGTAIGEGMTFADPTALAGRMLP